jgi:hypothetical protein
MSLCSMHFKSSDYKHQLGTISTVLRAKLDPEAIPSVLGPSVYKENSYHHYFKIGPQYSCRCAVSEALFVTTLYF